jgi:general secretion pathway protein A
MYEEFYGLKDRPFSLTPDPDFLYLSGQHKLARAYLEYGINQRVGFVVLTGEVGTGKTTLIKSLLKAREHNQRLGVLYQTSVEPGDLLELLLHEFEVRCHLQSRAARLSAFNHFLLTAYARGEHVVLIVDEAQNLGAGALEELRLLSNLQTEKELLLQIILVGQPSLRDRLRNPALRQLAQRVTVHYHLSPLKRQEAKEYIRYRLARAGGSGIFTDSALEQLFEYTGGVPRRLNAWCDLALVAGFAEGKSEIDGEFIDTVFAAQGGSLEGPTTLETQEAVEVGESPLGPEIKPSDNGLEARIIDLSGRLTRLEGLVLEMSSELIPVITRALWKPAPLESGLSLINDTPAGEELPSPEEFPSPVSSPSSKKKRWFRFWGQR